MVVVTHGPELRAFAKEYYEKYQAAVDRMAELAKEGIEFKMCNNAMQTAGFRADARVRNSRAAGFPELVYLESLIPW